MVAGVLTIVGAYLWGSIPSAYLVGRYLKGVDIRETGSGSVGATNLMPHAGKLAAFFLGTFDCVAKGTLPVLLAKLLDLSLTEQVLTGLAAIAGHNWSPYIKFSGGRGVATGIGVMLGFFMWGELLILAVVLGLFGAVVLGETGLFTLVSLLLLPLLAYFFDRPPEVIYMTLGIGGLILFKRLVANWEAPSGEVPLHRVLLYRVMWDRDQRHKPQWLERRGGVEERGSAGDAAD